MRTYTLKVVVAAGGRGELVQGGKERSWKHFPFPFVPLGLLREREESVPGKDLPSVEFSVLSSFLSSSFFFSLLGVKGHATAFSFFQGRKILFGREGNNSEKKGVLVFFLFSRKRRQIRFTPFFSLLCAKGFCVKKGCAGGRAGGRRVENEKKKRGNAGSLPPSLPPMGSEWWKTKRKWQKGGRGAAVKLPIAADGRAKRRRKKKNWRWYSGGNSPPPHTHQLLYRPVKDLTNVAAYLGCV